VDGRVIMYADQLTDSMMRAIQETDRRRALQQAFNEKHGIVPKTIVKSVREMLEISHSTAKEKEKVGAMASRIRSIRKVEPYHLYGIRYSDEKVMKKESKSGAKKK